MIKAEDPKSPVAYVESRLSETVTALIESTTMLQSTLLRLGDLPIESSITVCGEEHRFFVAEQLRSIDVQGTII